MGVPKFTPLQTTTTTRALSGRSDPNFTFLINLVRDHFTVRTWLLLGGLLQIALSALPIRRLYAILPVVTLLSWQILAHILMAVGLTRNVYMDGVIPGKTTAVFPEGSWGDDTKSKDGKRSPGGGSMVVFILGAKVNHPLGILAPGFKDLKDHSDAMQNDLEAHALEYGYIGASQWINGTDRSSANEFMAVMYFKTLEHLHKFAHSKVHRDGWDWWNRTFKRHAHLQIMHELYCVREGEWESIYINAKPTGFATTSHPVTGEDGETKWASPIVDASRGKFRSSKGRIGLDNGSGNEKYGDEPYEV